jgi:hypothetical protein
MSESRQKQESETTDDYDNGTNPVFISLSHRVTADSTLFVRRICHETSDLALPVLRRLLRHA